MTLDALVKVVAYGVPALLIVRARARLAGYPINTVAHDAGMMNTGIAMMATGILLYVIEFVAKIAYAYSGGQSTY
jgi:hypothetical protein